LMEFLVKLSKDEKLNENEINDLIEKNKKISEYMNDRSFSNSIDLDYLKKVLKQ